jgi:hypothetical protein
MEDFPWIIFTLSGERVSVMRTDYQQLLTDRDYLLRVGEMYQSVTLIEDVDDLAEEHQSMGDTSICVFGSG